MLAKLLTINGLTFDRTRTRLCHEFVIFHAGDEDGSAVAAAWLPHNWGRCPTGTVAVICRPRVPHPIFVDAQGCDLTPGSEGEDWAPLLDLAVEAGLQLPEGAEAGNSTLLRLPTPKEE